MLLSPSASLARSACPHVDAGGIGWSHRWVRTPCLERGGLPTKAAPSAWWERCFSAAKEQLRSTLAVEPRQTRLAAETTSSSKQEEEREENVTGARAAYSPWAQNNIFPVEMDAPMTKIKHRAKPNQGTLHFLHHPFGVLPRISWGGQSSHQVIHLELLDPENLGEEQCL